MSTLLRQRMHQDLQLAGLAEGTQKLTSAPSGSSPPTSTSRLIRFPSKASATTCSTSRTNATTHRVR